jgi:hypothetical protein
MSDQNEAPEISPEALAAYVPEEEAQEDGSN